MANVVDFSWLSSLPDVYRQAQQGAREDQFRRAFQGGLPRSPTGEIDFAAAADLAARAGNPSLALQLGHGQLDEQLKREQIKDIPLRRDISERQIRLQEESSREKPAVTWQEDSAGDKVPYRVEPFGKGVSRLPIEGQAAEAGNPFAPGGKMNEAQSKDALYATRMLQAEKILREPDVVGAATKSVERMRGAIGEKGPFGLARGVMTESYQKFDQAQRDFINATLRRESGAVISESEFDNARKQYFPQPSDPPAIIAQKQANRMEAIRGIGMGAGKAYRPPATFGPGGELVPTQPKTAPQATSVAPAGGGTSLAVGKVVNGYLFKGGDPNDKASWEQAR